MLGPELNFTVDSHPAGDSHKRARRY